jgi:hypothetical protein
MLIGKDARPWTHAALFGALWGCMELSLGTLLQLGHVPLKGFLMGALGMICLVALRRLQPRAGVCLIAGVVALFLKVFTLGGLHPGPVVGITVQALLVELAFLLTRSSAAGAVLGGALVMAVNPVQMALMTWIVAGTETVRAAEAAAGRLGLEGLDARTLLLVLVLAGGCLGAWVGAWSWALAGRALRRLGRLP